MLLVNLSHDPMMHALPQVTDVQHAVVDHEERYKLAAQRVGLTPREFDEMERRIAQGQVKRTTLPVRLDSMSGMHGGRIYAVNDVRVHPEQSAYAVVLSDGKRVYIPAECGNLSVVEPARHVAHTAAHRVVADAPTRAGAPRRPAHYVLARRTTSAPLAPGGGGGVLPSGTDVAAAAAPEPAEVAAAPIPSNSPQRGFHIPGIGWIAGAIGGIAAWWSGGETPSAPTGGGACPP